MARPIRETPILYGKDAERFVEEMKRVESLTTEQRKANREKLQAEIAVLDKECIGGKTKCVKMNETLNQWKAL